MHLETDQKKQISPEIINCIRRALEEDIGTGDVTTDSIVPMESTMNGNIISKQAGIVAGLDITQAVYKLMDQDIIFSSQVEEGEHVESHRILAQVSGSARVLLSAERTALNYLGRMSGIATLTGQYIDAVAGTRSIILDTRKTVPGLRILDKLAVKRGGGQNHRFGLYDMVLIKDNHIDFAGSLAEALTLVRDRHPDIEIEIEARTLEDVQAALSLGVSRILLDNMPVDMLRRAVDLASGQAKLEASGNVTLSNVRKVAETGVDYISIGALTHSVKVFDVSFLWVS